MSPVPSLSAPPPSPPPLTLVVPVNPRPPLSPSLSFSLAVECAQIELKYPINTHSATYDHARGSEIAQLTIKPDADPQNPDQGMFESGV